MDDLTGYDLIEYWDVTIEQQMPDGTLQKFITPSYNQMV